MTEDPKHNTGGSVAADELRLLIERIERLEGEMADLSSDRKDVYAEGKARGFDPRAMRVAVRARRMERQVFDERRAIEDTYLAALGLL